MYVLETDEGYLEYPKIVWQEIQSIDDSFFVDGFFNRVPNEKLADAPIPQGSSGVDQDRALAIKLMQEEEAEIMAEYERQNGVDDEDASNDRAAEGVVMGRAPPRRAPSLTNLPR